MIGLVVLDFDACVLTSGSPVVPGDMRHALGALAGAGVPLALYSKGALGDMEDSLGGAPRPSCLIACGREGAGCLLKSCPDGGVRSFETQSVAIRALAAERDLAPSDVLLIAADASGLALKRLGLVCVAPQDAPSALLLEADALIAPREEGSVASALEELSASLPWGELPVFLRGGSSRRGLGELEEVGPSRGGVPLMLLGLLVTALAVLFMLSLLSSNLPFALASVLLALVGLGIFYMGLGRSRDARKGSR